MACIIPIENSQGHNSQRQFGLAEMHLASEELEEKVALKKIEGVFEHITIAKAAVFLGLCLVRGSDHLQRTMDNVCSIRKEAVF